ncbi:MAG: hypothetical protein U9R72_12780 [Chloroflexota bacterium]|nr:hypothetical protein [Chloroflexota bacterium]
MCRLTTPSAAGAILALVCISLSSCVLSNAEAVQAPSSLPPELSIEEHALKEGPELEPLRFVPVKGTEEEILSKHQEKRASSPRSPCRHECEASLGDARLTASTYVTETSGGRRVMAEVSRGEGVIHSLDLGDPCAIPPLWGLWTYDGHWVLEAARVKARREGRAITCDPAGQIVRDGESLNEQHGYQESFGFQLLDDKPFYFFKRRGQVWMSYDGREIPLGYTHVSHYQCCSGAAVNVRSSSKMVAFFASDDSGTRYYVEIGVFE